MNMWRVVLSVFLVVVVIGLNGGCATSHEDGITISGDVPAIGDTIYVHKVISRDADGPYEHVVVWECGGGQQGDVRVMKTHNGHFSRIAGGGEGYYTVVRDGETKIGLIRQK